MKKALTLFILSFSLWACNDNALVDQYHSIENETWSYNQVITDSFEVTHPGFYHLVYANLRITGDYGWSNMQLKMTFTDPTGKKTEREVPVLLAEKSGKWLGSGLGSTLTYQTPVLGKQEFKHKGTYRVSIQQNMRIEQLAHVKAVGIKVERGEEIY